MPHETKTSTLDTRERILAAGAALVHARGFNNTGLKDILEAADVPKGSFYFYFKNKEAFGLELVDFHLCFYRDQVAGILSRQDLGPVERVTRFFAWFHSHFRDKGFAMGCPIGNLCQEMSDLSPPFRNKLGEAMSSIIRTIASQLEQAREAGDIPREQDPGDLASFLVASWQGAVLLMKLEKSDRPLVAFEQRLPAILNNC